MATNVILPALGMSQDTGKILQWLKGEGEQVAKGEPLAEIETDKATVEIESPADGILSRISASAGDDVPVGQVIAIILTPGEVSPESKTPMDQQHSSRDGTTTRPQLEATRQPVIAASPLASRMAAEYNLDLSQVKSSGRRIQKADVLTHLQGQEKVAPAGISPRLALASPKARRLATEQGKDLSAIRGTGPGGAVLAADILAATVGADLSRPAPLYRPIESGSNEQTSSNIWRIMAERTTQSWTNVPHFYLVREVNASSLIAWREQILQRSTEKVTYTDLLVKIVAAALCAHPRLNASLINGKITLNQAVHIGLATAIEEGLVVPVIHLADTLSLREIALQRIELLAKAQAGKLRPPDISDGTFTISNLGMYHVDAFNAIINQPQVAILAVGRITERVVPLNGQPAVQPTMVLTLSCDHRAVDGASGAQFLDTIATFIEEPLLLIG
jgi:pyruvate dehydrogenase E2 component (dihydrolipoamide acetyltransferase)